LISQRFFIGGSTANLLENHEYLIPSCVQTCLAPGKFTIFNIIIDLIDIFKRLKVRCNVVGSWRFGVMNISSDSGLRSSGLFVIRLCQTGYLTGIICQKQHDY